MATPPTLIPSHTRPPAPTYRPKRRHGDPGAVIFLIGLVALLASRTLWPGILLLIGITNLLHQAARGRADKGLRALLWLGGLTLLFATGTFWPGILILFIISLAMGGGRSRPWYW
jgi:hypothetical protein